MDDVSSDTPSARSVPIGRLALASVTALLTGLLLRSFLVPSAGPTPGAALGSAIEAFAGERPERTVEVYDGHGAWVDAFDYLPAYTDGAPSLDISALDDMVDAGVRTIYLQAARDDERALGLVVDPAVVGRWLIEAHRRDLLVVAWYLPSFVDVERDLDHLRALDDFEVLGHGFDGLAIDIEATVIEDPLVRSNQLVEFSKRLRGLLGDEAIGAIVLPPVLLEVVNPRFWPDFPWRRLEPLYDVWLPMTYWSQRTRSSGYQNGATYFGESDRRMKANLGTEDVRVHGIGGIGDDLTDEDLLRFAAELRDTGSVGWSIYDWATLPDSQRRILFDALGS